MAWQRRLLTAGGLLLAAAGGATSFFQNRRPVRPPVPIAPLTAPRTDIDSRVAPSRFRSGDTDESGALVYHGWVTALYTCSHPSATNGRAPGQPGRHEDDGCELWLSTDAGERFPLRIAPPELGSMGGILAVQNQPVTVRGRFDGASGVLAVRKIALRPRLAAETPFRPVRRTTRGRDADPPAYPFLNILARFSDSPTVTPNPREYYVNLMRNSYPGLDHYFRDVSHNQICVAGSEFTNWINLPRNKAYYTDSNGMIDYDKVLRDATAVVDPQYDFKRFYGVNVFVNEPLRVSRGGGIYLTLDGRQGIWGGTTNSPGHSQSLMAHEMGHAFGIPHSSSPYNKIYDSRWDVMSGGSFYVNDPAFASYLGIGMCAFNRNIGQFLPPGTDDTLKGAWLESRNVIVVPGDRKTVRLERLSTTTGNATRMVTVYGRGLASRFLTIEARQFHGYDDARVMPRQGILLHDVNLKQDLTDSDWPASTGNGYGLAVVVDADNNGDCNDDGAVWTVGETYRDAGNGVTMSVDSADATGYTVTVSVDAARPLPSVVRSTADDGAGSLREALAFAARHPQYPLDFNMPTSDPGYSGGVFTISLKTPLPPVTQNALVIDGGRQTTRTGDTNPTGPEVALDGSQIADWGNGLTVRGGSIQIRGLAIGNFPSNGIAIEGARDTLVRDCYVGLNAGGAIAAKNRYAGLSINGGARDIRVENCVASGNDGQGLYAENTRNLTITGGRFGTNFAGAARVPNKYDGIALKDSVAQARIENVLASGNDGNGMWIEGEDIAIVGCRAGTNADGSARVANGYSGVALVNGSRRATIDQCLLSGNGTGLYIGGGRDHQVKRSIMGLAADGRTVLANQTGVTLASGSVANRVGELSGTPCVISGNTGNGVYIGDEGTTGNMIVNCRIGTDSTGAIAVPNVYSAVAITRKASDNTIGEPGETGRCVLVGATNSLVYIADSGTRRNRFRNCHMGLSANGVAQLSDCQNVGIFDQASENVIGGSTAAERNLLVSRGTSCVYIANASGNIVSGNWIGMNVSGEPTGDSWGVQLREGSRGNRIGGTRPGDGNRIRRGDIGIYVGDLGSTGNSILGNAIWGFRFDAIRLNAGGNTEIAPPRIISATSADGFVWIVGETDAAAGSSFRIEAFSNPSATTGPSQAERWIGATRVASPNAGAARFLIGGPMVDPAQVTLTRTDSSGNTSQLTPAFANVANGSTAVRATLAPARGRTGSTATLVAGLSAGGRSLANQSVVFRVDGAIVGTARTDGRGVARLIVSLSSGWTVGEHAARAEFYGSGVHSPGAADATVVVLP